MHTYMNLLCSELLVYKLNIPLSILPAGHYKNHEHDVWNTVYHPFNHTCWHIIHLELCPVRFLM